ncbi:PDZ domain-containing protein [Akkermansiaceae bacterium]|nr:PDZ domain-containing protein [bacterium]MDB4469659.1 PDZ domain-containing protein [Akkermansiaceae bacterium]
MSITISWCEVCDDGSLEGDPPFSYCRECGFGFHAHCAVECDEDDEDDDGEVSSERCPKCQGKHIDPHSKGFAEGYCQALTASNVRVLTVELAIPLLNLEEHTGIVLDLPTICEFEDLVISHPHLGGLSQKKFRVRTFIEDERLEDVTERLTPEIVEEAISSYLGFAESIDLSGYYLATKGALDSLKKSIFRIQLGISYDWEDIMEGKLTVEDVEESSLAETLGILPGDIIVGVNGVKVDEDHPALAEDGYLFGDPFLAEHTLSISREGELLDIAIGEDHAERPHIELDVVLNEDNREELVAIASKKHNRWGELTSGAIVQPNLLKIDSRLAESVSKHKGMLLFSGLTELSDAAAESLSRHKGDLSLDALSELSDAAAESLSKHKGKLNLAGLTELSDAAAGSLSTHKGGLNLCGLTELSEAAGESLSSYEGDLDLGLKKLTQTSLVSKLSRQDDLWLDRLTELPDWVAEIFSGHQGDLWLNGVTALSDAAADSLSRHKGIVALGLTSISESTAESLSKLENLGLESLTTISDEAAVSLSQIQGDLWLDQSIELSAAAAETLASKQGSINQEDPKEWVDSLRASKE